MANIDGFAARFRMIETTLVRRSEVIGIMEQLEALGASAILETQITNCRL